MAKQVPRPIGPYRRPKPDLYTFMLIVAFIALLVAIVALWAHMAEYNYQIKGGPSVPAPAAGSSARIHEGTVLAAAAAPSAARWQSAAACCAPM